jgi:hypothetical protein
MAMKRFYRQLKWIALLALCFGLMGCLTAAKVKSIVEESNTMLLEQALTRSQNQTLISESEEMTSGSPDPEKFNDLINRIHGFIENHPDDAKIINPLRVRLGVLYMFNKKPGLAETVFETVEAAHLENERDKFLTKHNKHFIWWYAEKGQHLRTSNDKTRGLALLKEVRTEELESTELKAFFEQVRANVAFEVIAQMNPRDDQGEYRQVMNSVIAAYTGHWSVNHRKDIKHIRSKMGQSCVTQDFKTGFFLRPDEAAAIEKMITEAGVEIFKMYPTIFCTVERIQNRWRPVSNDPLQTPSWIKCSPPGETITCDVN